MSRGFRGVRPSFGVPLGPFALSRDPLEGPQRPNFTKSGMGFLESTHFLDYISLVPTSGWPVMLFPPPRIRKRAPYGRFGRFWNKTDPPSVLSVCRSNGRVSVPFFWFGRVVYMCAICLGGFGGSDQVSGSPGPIFTQPRPSGRPHFAKFH